MQAFWNDKFSYNVNSIDRYGAGFPLTEKNEEKRLLLNGTWKFKFCKSILDVVDGYESEGFDDSVFDDITVPSNWQLQGYDTPIYTNIAYPYALASKNLFSIPYVNPKKNSVGLYITYFDLEELTDNVFINFGGINSTADVYINGSFVGYSEDSFDFQEYNITDFIKKGRNKIAVTVYRYCTGSYLEDQDMWRISGIFRDVNLIFKPKAEIRDFFATSTISVDYQSAYLNVKTQLTGLDAGCTLTVNLSYQGDTVLERELPVEQAEVLLQEEIASVLLWSHEIPNLYDLELTLKREGTFLDRRCCRFGFRKIEIVPMKEDKGPYILLNGKPVKFYGVNRHEFHPEYGHAVPREKIEEDIRLCLENNITAIRTSHYPNSKYFYEMCDEMGVLVMCENNLETHGLSFMLPKNNPVWTEQCIYRVRNMVHTYKNHACIVSWSLGNESGYGEAFVKMREAVLKIDKTRFIHYEEDISATTSDVVSEMYARLEKMDAIGQNKKIKHCQTTVFCPLGVTYHSEQYRDKPYLQCEYSHAMGNSLGNFSDYWEKFHQYDRLAGGFIWDFADQAIKVVKDGKTEWRYGGDFGDKPNSGVFAFNGIFRADREPNPALYEVKKVHQQIAFTLDGSYLTLSSRFLFKELHGMLKMVFYADGISCMEENHELALKAGETHQIEVIIPDTPGEISLYAEISLLEDGVVLKKGHVIAYEQFLLKERLPEVDEILPGTNYSETAWEIEINSDTSRYIIERATGAITSISVAGKEKLRAPFLPNFHRATIDNDRFAQINLKLVKKIMGVYKFRDAQKKLRPKHIEIAKKDEVVEVCIRWRMGHLRALETVYRFGKEEIDVAMRVVGNCPLVRYGFTFGLRKEFHDIAFYGKGPFENYCDRKTAAVLKQYEGTAEDFLHDYLMPQENGNHTDTRFLSIADGSGCIEIIAEDKAFEFSVHPYTLEMLENATHLHELDRLDYYTVNIDGRQRGVGGDIPALACLKPQYKISPKVEHTLRFRMRME